MCKKVIKVELLPKEIRTLEMIWEGLETKAMIAEISKTEGRAKAITEGGVEDRIKRLYVLAGLPIGKRNRVLLVRWGQQEGYLPCCCEGKI